MTANEVDSALAAPAREVGPMLLAAQEDQWYDRKSARVSPKDLGIPLVALANAEGGVIVIGLSNGKIEGIRERAGKINDLRQAPMSFKGPPVRGHL